MTIPLFFTMIRLVGSLFFLPVFFVYFLPVNLFLYNIYASILFLLIGVTDFFDGYYARKLRQTTQLGALLDPLADKIFIMVTLVCLVFTGKLWFYWAIIFIGREFLVMGLREVALHQGFSLPVGYSGKLKTVVQIAFFAFVILNPYQAFGSHAPWWNGCEFVVLMVALVLSIVSALFYAQIFWRTIKS